MSSIERIKLQSDSSKSLFEQMIDTQSDPMVSHIEVSQDIWDEIKVNTSEDIRPTKPGVNELITDAALTFFRGTGYRIDDHGVKVILDTEFQPRTARKVFNDDTSQDLVWSQLKDSPRGMGVLGGLGLVGGGY